MGTESEALVSGRSLARVGRARRPRTGFGEVLEALLRGKGWSLRDLEAHTRLDREHGTVSHQHISDIMRGGKGASARMMNRLLAPFGYRAVLELRLEPLPGFVGEPTVMVGGEEE